MIRTIVVYRHAIRVTLLLGNLILFTVLVAIGGLTPIPLPVAQELYNELASIPITPVAIFFHNMQIILLEVIPFLGTFFLMLSGFSSGLGLSAICLVEGISPPDAIWSLLNQFPHTWLEFFAYSLAAVEGTMVFLMLIAVGFRLLFRRELEILVLTFVGCNMLLAVASVFETAAILYGYLAVVITWIAFGALVVAVVYYDAKKRGMKLPHPLIPLVFIEMFTLLGLALPTLLIFALLLWTKHVKYKVVPGKG
ncbi:MAG: hypothetical protein WED05_10380 [Candidatus Atabeyarchaeum deiterrae]